MKTLPFMSEELKQFLDKFPELKPAVAETVKKIVDTGEWETVMSDFAYKPASRYPRTITVKHTCKKKSMREKVIQSFSCSWKPE